MDEEILKKSGHKIFYIDHDFLIKTYDDTYSVSQVLNESLNQAKVVEAGIKAPKIFEVKMYNGRLGIVMDYIKGQDLQSLMYDDKENNKYLDIFVNMQHKLFSTKIHNLNNSYGRIKNKIFATNLPANIQYGLFFKLREMEFSHDVIHGDYFPSNVIIDQNDNAYVLDWSHVAFGDRKLDIAISYALFDIDGKSEIGDKYLESICKIENVERNAIIDKLLLAYIYIVDRYDENKQHIIYDKIYDIIRKNEV